MKEEGVPAPVKSAAYRPQCSDIVEWVRYPGSVGPVYAWRRDRAGAYTLLLGVAPDTPFSSQASYIGPLGYEESGWFRWVPALEVKLIRAANTFPREAKGGAR